MSVKGKDGTLIAGSIYPVPGSVRNGVAFTNTEATKIALPRSNSAPHVKDDFEIEFVTDVDVWIMLGGADVVVDAATGHKREAGVKWQIKAGVHDYMSVLGVSASGTIDIGEIVS